MSVTVAGSLPPWLAKSKGQRKKLRVGDLKSKRCPGLIAAPCREPEPGTQPGIPAFGLLLRSVQPKHPNLKCSLWL